MQQLDCYGTLNYEFVLGGTVEIIVHIYGWLLAIDALRDLYVLTIESQLCPRRWLHLT